MKIGILTQQLNNNYGGLLQNYALQQVLIKMGHNPITLDWDYPVEPVQRPLWKSMLMPIRDIVNGMKKKMRPAGKNGWYEPSQEERKVISRNNQAFVSKYINTTKKLLSSQELLDYSIEHQLDALVAGSDQCWRPIYTKTHLPDAFFSFASGLQIKRLAYAASFGTDAWEFTPEQETVCKALAQQFDLVTDKWIDCVILLQIMCFTYMFQPAQILNLNLLQVKGRTELTMKLELFKKSFFTVAIIIAVQYGLIVLCVVDFFLTMIALCINTYYTGRLINVGYLKQMRDMLPHFVLSIAMFVIVYFFICLFSNEWFQLMVGGIVGLVFYFVVAWLLRFEEFSDLRYMLNRHE